MLTPVNTKGNTTGNAICGAAFHRFLPLSGAFEVTLEVLQYVQVLERAKKSTFGFDITLFLMAFFRSLCTLKTQREQKCQIPTMGLSVEATLENFIQKSIDQKHTGLSFVIHVDLQTHLIRI